MGKVSEGWHQIAVVHDDNALAKIHVMIGANMHVYTYKGDKCIDEKVFSMESWQAKNE